MKSYQKYLIRTGEKMKPKTKYDKMISGQVCYHKKLKMNNNGCVIEPTIKRNLEYVSVCLGYKNIKDDITIDEAKMVLKTFLILIKEINAFQKILKIN